MSSNRLKVDSTLIVGGTSGADSYNGVISVLNSSSSEVVRLDRNGLTAIAGKVAGFTMSGNSLTNTTFESDAAIILRKDSSNIFVGIGANVWPATTGERCLLRLENAESTSIGVDNYGAFISIKNAGGRNIALKAIGAI